MVIRLILTALLYVAIHLVCMAQMNVETGVNILYSSNKLGSGAFIEPQLSLNEISNLSLHVGVSTYIGPDTDRTKSKRITTGTIYTIVGNYQFLFGNGDSNALPYISVGGGGYISNKLDLGGRIGYGFLIGRSSVGLTFNFISEDNYFQLGYGFRLFRK